MPSAHYATLGNGQEEEEAKLEEGQSEEQGAPCARRVSTPTRVRRKAVQEIKCVAK